MKAEQKSELYKWVFNTKAERIRKGKFKWMLHSEKWHQIFSGVIISSWDEDLHAGRYNFSGSLTSDPLTCIYSAAGYVLLFLPRPEICWF